MSSTAAKGATQPPLQGPPIDLNKSGASTGTGKGGIIIVNNMNPSCWTTQNLLKIAALTGVVFSIALLAFLACYTDGVFHFERFIGHIGPYVMLPLASCLVVASLVALYFSFRMPHEKESRPGATKSPDQTIKATPKVVAKAV